MLVFVFFEEFFVELLIDSFGGGELERGVDFGGGLGGKRVGLRGRKIGFNRGLGVLGGFASSFLDKAIDEFLFGKF